MTPEKKARGSNDVLLVAAGCHGCNVSDTNIHVSAGIVIREVDTNLKHAPALQQALLVRAVTSNGFNKQVRR